MLLKRHKDSHKGSSGIILVIGGSDIYTGAPALSALGALRAGADLAVVAAPERAANIVASFSPDLITIPLSGLVFSEKHFPLIKPWLEKANVVVIGPGLGKGPRTKKAVVSFIKSCKKPLVVDADALKAISANLKILKGKECVLTPHRKEFETLSRTKATKENVKAFAALQDQVVLVKGSVDIVSDGKKLKQNKTGNAGMTVGGTGDVLAGLVAALIGQGFSLFDAAYNAANVNGLAGDACYKEKRYCFLASDLLEKIPDVMGGL